MILFFDENLPPKVADGLRLLVEAMRSCSTLSPTSGERVKILTAKGLKCRGKSDEELFEILSKQREHVVFVTSDSNIQNDRVQRELFQRHGHSLLILRATKKNPWNACEVVYAFIKNWNKLIEYFLNNNPQHYLRMLKTGIKEFDKDKKI